MRKALLVIGVILISLLIFYLYRDYQNKLIFDEQQRADLGAVQSDSKQSIFSDAAKRNRPRKQQDEIKSMFEEAQKKKREKGSSSRASIALVSESTNLGRPDKTVLSLKARQLLADPKVQRAMAARKKVCRNATDRIKSCSGYRPIHRKCSFRQKVNGIEMSVSELTACLEAEVNLYQCGNRLPCLESIQWWNRDSRTLCHKEEAKRNVLCGEMLAERLR